MLLLLMRFILCCACLCVECVSNVDETLGEMFLEEKTPTDDDIKVSCDESFMWNHL